MTTDGQIHRFLVTAPRGLADLVARELEQLGGRSVSVDPYGARVRGPLSFGYRICLWSRLASRVLLPLVELISEDADQLAANVAGFAWEDHLGAEASLAIDYVGRGMGIDHTQYGAQRIKDGIVDRLRERTGRRPSVDTRDPDIRIRAVARGRACQLSLDLSGHGLHRRGYRVQAGAAPLRENLAAVMLHDGQWRPPDPEGMPAEAVVDPMCGAGTLVIEAALIACDRAPGLSRERFGFERWKGHDPAAWAELRAEAQARVRTPRRVVAYGYDEDEGMVRLAQANAARAGVNSCVRFVQARCADVPAVARGGLVVTNPPYGQRMGTRRVASEAYAELGRTLRARFGHWRACVISTDDVLLTATGLVPTRSRAVLQGALEARIVAASSVTPPRGDLVNRLRKNLKRLAKWRAREHVEVYRLYDADLPEYAAAVDVYRERAVVQEYAPPAEIPPDKAAARRLEIVVSVAEVLGIASHQIHVKTRQRQRGSEQYRRRAEDPAVGIVHESGLRFRVDLASYLDTGLFCDHRRTRALAAELAANKDVLNLFGYTGTASVYAARGGANSTTTVDLSKTYLEWAKRNFELNGIEGTKHRLLRADVLSWMGQERRSYDLVFCDPPTFSNSKAMSSTWDVQRDHAGLLRAVEARLRPKGTILFSTNARKFTLSPDLGPLDAVEITHLTTSPDFARRPLHRSWRLTKR